MSSQEFDPLQWPPDMNLAKLHFECCKPGIDNPEGPKCPCCHRSEKLTNARWPMRDITKDFKNYGGGIPSYFYLVKYLMAVLVVIAIVKVIFHIMILDQVCPTLQGTHQRCALVFGVFYFCDMEILFNTLNNEGNTTQATILEYMQLATYLILVLATLGIKIFLHILNQKTTLDQKLFSRFALIIKSVPLYYQLQDLEKQLKVIVPELSIAEMFYIHKTCECDKSLRALIDMHFAMKNIEEQLKDNKDDKLQKKYRKMKEEYLKQFDKYEMNSANLNASSKKVLIVFNTIQQKQKIHNALKMSEFTKFCYYSSKLVGYKSASINYYSQRIAQPQEIYWKYIGESSTHKQKVRIETTIIGVALVFICFAIFYFPLLKIDQQKIFDPSLGTGLGMVVSLVVFLLVIIFRGIIASLMPTRRPSSKLSQSYFMVITVAMFFFFFYLVSPALFYIFSTSIPQNYKLAQFFMAVLIFCVGNIFIASLDLGYLFWNMKKKKLLSQRLQANTFCQGRLHEQVTPPPFPVSFKLVVAFNMWSFNSYYIFNIPYLVVMFFIALLVLYWIDKYILYNHYKMQSYLSMEIEHQSQKVVLVVFLACVSLGYLTIANYEWEQWLILVVFILAIIANFLLQSLFKKQKEEVFKNNTDLKGAIEKCMSDINAANLLNLMDTDLKASFMLNNPKDLGLELEEASVASAIVFYGYHESYQLYLSQFHRKQVNQIIENRYFDIKRTHSRARKSESELAKLVDGSLEQRLLDVAEGIQKDKEKSPNGLGLSYRSSGKGSRNGKKEQKEKKPEAELIIEKSPSKQASQGQLQEDQQKLSTKHEKPETIQLNVSLVQQEKEAVEGNHQQGKEEQG